MNIGGEMKNEKHLIRKINRQGREIQSLKKKLNEYKDLVGNCENKTDIARRQDEFESRYGKSRR